MVDLHLSGLVAELQSQFHVLGKGLRFLLCKGCHDGQKNFALGIHRINIFFLEVHGNVLFFQLTDVFQAIQRIASESADGLLVMTMSILDAMQSSIMRLNSSRFLVLVPEIPSSA